MKHLGPADYRRQPWANGRGETIEMLRIEQNGALALRLSMATVDQDGDFSIFPEIERNLTVLSGPGFDLQGAGLHLTCAPLAPVAFAGDLPLRAVGVSAPSVDFNVMTARSLPHPVVSITPAAEVQGGSLAILALDQGAVDGTPVQRHDLILTRSRARLSGAGLFVVVALTPPLPGV